MKQHLLFITILICQIGICQDISTGLVAHLPFTGNANDISGNSLNANVSGATLTTDISGKPNNAYYFNGTNAYLSIPNNIKLNPSSITYSTWIKTEYSDFNFFYPILSKGKLADTLGTQNAIILQSNENNIIDSIYFPVKTAGCDYYYANTELNDITAGFTFTNGTWYNVVATYLNGLQKVFVNGNLILQKSGINSKTMLACTSPLLIGAASQLISFNDTDYSLATAYFVGSIDEVRIYNRALTDADVKQLYLNTTGLERASYISLDKMIYPNPGIEGKFYLSKNITDIQSILITDLAGKHQPEISYNGDYIDMSQIDHGVYVMKITTNKGVYSGKIIN